MKTIETYGEHFETDHLKTIETYGEIWKHFETHNFENTLKHMIWKHFETYGEIWKQFETHNLKTIETYGEIWKHIETYGEIWKHFETHNFENHWNLWGNLKTLLKHIIWKPLKHMGNFETHNLKTIETYGEIWKHFETHHLKTIETYGIWNLKHIFENHWNLWGNLKTLETHNFENTLKPWFENFETLWKT